MGGSFARTGVPQALSTATYDAANQQLTLGNASMMYDADGNLTTLTDPSGTTTYTWNARNQLAALSGPGISASFQYDARGRRRQKTLNGTATAFLYDGDTIVQELSGGTPTVNLLAGLEIDEVLTRTDANGSRSLHSDALGSVIALSDAGGTIQTQYTYEPYGQTTASGAPSANPFQYTGRENDGTGLYYYRERYYSPTSGRFLSEDPIQFQGGIDFYEYVESDPINSNDPYGTAPPKTPRVPWFPIYCHPWVFTILDYQIDRYCKEGDRRCTSWLSCSELQRRISQNSRCLEARKSLMQKCFKGGDQEHKNILIREIGVIEHCIEILETKQMLGECECIP